MHKIGTAIFAGLAAAMLAQTDAEALETSSGEGHPGISGGLNLSHAKRPFPRPPIIVNSKPSAPADKTVASNQTGKDASSVCDSRTNAKVKKESCAQAGQKVSASPPAS